MGETRGLATETPIVVAKWTHARWIEPHTPVPGEMHLRTTNGADPISATCGACGEVLLPSAFTTPEEVYRG